MQNWKHQLLNVQFKTEIKKLCQFFYFIFFKSIKYINEGKFTQNWKRYPRCFDDDLQVQRRKSQFGESFSKLVLVQT